MTERNINIVMHGGAKIGYDAIRQDPKKHQWVKKNAEPHKPFDAQNENETFKKARKELLKLMLHLHQLRSVDDDFGQQYLAEKSLPGFPLNKMLLAQSLVHSR